MRAQALLQVVALARESAYKLRSDGKVSGVDENVVREIEFFEQRDPTVKVGPKHIEVIRLVMKHMAHRLYLWRATSP